MNKLWHTYKKAYYKAVEINGATPNDRMNFINMSGDASYIGIGALQYHL